MVMHESDRVTVLEPTHDLYEGGECDRLEQELLRLAESGAYVVVNVSGVQHLTARCLGILAHAVQVASTNGGAIALCGATHIQAWLLHETGLDGVIPVTSDVASAKRHLESLHQSVA